MELPIGSIQLMKEPGVVGLGLIVPMSLKRSKTFQFRGEINSGTGTAVFKALGSNVAKPTTLGDFVQIGTDQTLNLVATGTVSLGVEDLYPWKWVSVYLVSVSAGGQVEAWLGA